MRSARRDESANMAILPRLSACQVRQRGDAELSPPVSSSQVRHPQLDGTLDTVNRKAVPQSTRGDTQKRPPWGRQLCYGHLQSSEEPRCRRLCSLSTSRRSRTGAGRNDCGGHEGQCGDPRIAEPNLATRQIAASGSRWADLRNTLKRGEHDGFTVEIAEPPLAPSLIANLKVVSDAWLHDRRSYEMAFSVAGFQHAFVSKQQLALLRQDGKIVAFVSLHDDRAEQRSSDRRSR